MAKKQPGKKKKNDDSGFVPEEEIFNFDFNLSLSDKNSSDLKRVAENLEEVAKQLKLQNELTFMLLNHKVTGKCDKEKVKFLDGMF